MQNSQLENARELPPLPAPQTATEPDVGASLEEVSAVNHDDNGAVIQLGLDDGYAYTKLALADGRLVAIPSRGRIGQAGITWMDAAQQQIFEYDTEGSRYAVGQIDGESTCYDGYPISGLHRAIVQHAFQEAKLAGHSVHVVSGLPVSSFYFKDGQKREQAISLKCDSLKIAVQPVSTGGLYATQRLPVAVAFDSGNLVPVAKVLRQFLPTARICIAGDEDKETEKRIGKNPGRLKAEEAAKAVNGVWVVPEFAEAADGVD